MAKISSLTYVILLIHFLLSTGTPPKDQELAPSRSIYSPSTVYNVLDSVTSAFMETNSPGDCHWQRATYFFGHTEAMNILNSTTTLDYAVSWGDGNNYECDDMLDPNDFGSGWGYMNLYIRQPTDYKLALGNSMNRALGGKVLPPYSFWWVDTLAMNIPQWLLYGTVLQEKITFYNFVVGQYNNTKYGGPDGASRQPGLYNPTYHLWYRDMTFVNGTSPNGSPIFWGRGNGWASVMIVKVLNNYGSGTNDPFIQELETTLVEMAQALVPLQNKDTGFWSTSLTDSEHYPNPETTGTAGILALFAFGVRKGLLDSATYLPIISLAWNGLYTVTLANGTTGIPQWCQPVGDQPFNGTVQTDTSDFCSGFVLLAATEMYYLVNSSTIISDQLEQLRVKDHLSSVLPLIRTKVPGPPYDLRPFENTLLPQWLDQFTVKGHGEGKFTYTNNGNIPMVYGSAGVIHALSVVQQLNLSSSSISSWGNEIDSFENATTGFYNLQPVEMNAGYQPWHASGWVMAALRILGRRPLYPPAFAQEIALGGLSVWNSSIGALFTDSAGIWPLSHKVASVSNVLLIDDPSHYNVTYAPYFTWLWEFLNNNSNPEVGYWCDPPNVMPPKSMGCLGGAFHIAFTLVCNNQLFPHAEAMLNITLNTQNPTTGLWNGDGTPGYMDQDGIYVAIKTSLQLNRARWNDIYTMCERYVTNAVTTVLLNSTALLTNQTMYGSIVHTLPGVVTPVALCANYFPNLTITERPWINTVDIGCFG